ncbi:MAG: DNA polymerase I [Chlorobi bacterium]|nr:DNA polymerase I [Chlorobiota bacterium]
MEGNRKLILIDAYALIFRSYYAFIRNPRITSKGQNTSAVFGFTLTLDDLIRKFSPGHIAIVFDPPRPTFRHKIYPKYKANREQTPEDIKSAVPYIKQLAEAYGIPILEIPGYEADDVIGTLSKKAAASGYRSFMVTSDKDYLQLLSPDVYMLKPPRGGGNYEIIGMDDLPEVFHVENPGQVIDILALWGDSSDNIPGAPGVGQKTAIKLIEEFGSLENLLANTDKLKGKLKENIENNKKQILLSKDLATIRTDVKLGFDLETMKYRGPDKIMLTGLFRKLEFNTLAKRLIGHETNKQENLQQGSLFSGQEQKSESNQQEEKKETIQSVKHLYRQLNTKEEMRILIGQLSEAKAFCFDSETTSLDVMSAELVGISFAFKDHEAWWVPVPENRAEALRILEEFRPVFEDENVMKIGQNLKFDLHILRNYDLPVKGKLFDTMLAHYLLYPDQRHNLNFMAESLLNYTPVHIEEIIGDKKQQQLSMRDANKEELKEYAAEDADITWQLWELLSRELKKQEMMTLAEKIEMPLVEVLLEMERTGFRVDRKILDNYAGQLRDDLVSLEKEIHEMAGEAFNVSSPKQLGVILYERLKITDNIRKTKTKQYSTSEETLMQLSDKHPIVGKVLEYRSVRKLLTSYIEPLPFLINPETGRIHTEFNQAIAVTGRLSSANPNLQNIPVREERGREIRKAFVASDSQHIILSADYSQIELRLMAHFSGDEEMMLAFRKNRDIHIATAAKIYEVPEEEVSREMRNHAKTANFGIIYGISAFGLAQRLQLSRTKAKEIIDGYFRSFPGVKKYMDESIARAREKGYAETIFGRRRYLRDIHSSNSVVRSMAERNAINAPIQGSAADIIKLAMINIHRKLKNTGYRSKMILQVHDELLFDVYKPEKDLLIDLVREEMEHVVKLKVPLVVDYGTGDNWLEAH